MPRTSKKPSQTKTVKRSQGKGAPSSVKTGKKRRKWPLFVIAIPSCLGVGAIGWVCHSADGRVYRNVEAVPDEPVAVVFGAGLAPGGGPSQVLRGRLDGAIALYRKHKVRSLLMSGDNRWASYDEPEAMREYAVQHGVPSSHIVLDYAGRDTYDTCYRAHSLFGVKKAVFVTQDYHADRAVFLGRSMGIDAIAYAVPNLDQYPALQFRYSSREYLADLKAWWDAEITHRKPYVDQAKDGSP